MRRAMLEATFTDFNVAGPQIGLSEGTQVMTTQGICAVETLVSGDRIITAIGAIPLVSLIHSLDGSFVLDFDTPQTVLIHDDALGHSTWATPNHLPAR